MWYVPAFRGGLVPLTLMLNFIYGGSIEDVCVFQSNWGGMEAYTSIYMEDVYVFQSNWGDIYISI
ncbi:hypothetical protein Syun_004001 [Stephania yunnanensis]|uniref:Uncharacterized protein n=1 Tax=Stephania yunnanensis TaxID=152371 RepID=A0AAP0L5F8_9MAGN